MPEPIHLPLSLVIEKGRQAYLEGRLSAQGPTPACRYRDGSGRPCVIGAALSDEEAARLDATRCGITGLHTRALITTDREGFLVALQNAHDAWADRVVAGAHELARNSEARLRSLLGLEAKATGEGA